MGKISLTAIKFPDIPRFSRQAVTLCLVYIFIIKSYTKYTRELKLLTSARSRPNETDVEPFRTKINLSTALAMATTRGSDLHKNSCERNCGDTTKISGPRLTCSARGYDSAVCCSKMSCDAFLSEALYEADKALEKFAAASWERACYKMTDRADGKSKMHVLFYYLA